MEPLGWQRVRLDPSTPLWWRADGTFVIGHTDDLASAPVQRHSDATEFATLCQLLDGTHSAHQLLQSGAAMGLSTVNVRSFLVELAAAGHIHEVEVDSLPTIAHSTWRNVKHLARVHGRAETHVLAAREHYRVLVVGVGAVAAQLYAQCVQAGLRTGWAPESNRKIRLDDCVATYLNPDLVGMRWQELAVDISSPRLVVSVAQSHSSLQLQEYFGEALVLPLTVHQRRMSIGPLLNAYGGLCAECADAHRAAADPDWSYRQAQLADSGLAPPVIADAFRDAFVGSALTWILELADTSSTHGLHLTSWELLPPTPLWQMRRWSRANDCACNDFQEVAPAI